jgi:hypothetical protein
MAAAPKENVFEKIRDTVILPYWSVINEIQRLFPDSVLFGSIILYLATMNGVFGYFAIFLLEVFASHKLLATILAKFVGPLQSESSSGSDVVCFPGFRGARREVERTKRFNEFPSISITSLSAVTSYIIASMVKFKETLDYMGPEWKSRFGFSMFFTLFILLSVVAFRFFNGCESVKEIMIAVIYGLIVGGIFFVVNNSLFGPESVNFLGLPYIVDKSKQGSDIYTCAPTNINYQ